MKVWGFSLSLQVQVQSEMNAYELESHPQTDWERLRGGDFKKDK